MSALIRLLSVRQTKNEKKSIVTKLAERMNQLSEAFWFTLSLGLFIVLGPFSIFAVIIGVYSLATKYNNSREPETI